MAQQVKTPVVNPGSLEFDPWDPKGKKKELTPSK